MAHGPGPRVLRGRRNGFLSANDGRLARWYKLTLDQVIAWMRDQIKTYGEDEFKAESLDAAEETGTPVTTLMER